MDYRLIFLISALAGATFLVAGVHYYFRTREDALNRRIEELQEESMAGSAIPAVGGDFLDAVLRSTYGLVFGKAWFRQKEVELMRAGFRGRRAVKVYGVVSFAFNFVLPITAFVGLWSQDSATRIFGIAAALVLGYFIPEQVLTSLRTRHRLSLMAALPDTTDMLSIVLGAGLSLDRSEER